MSDVAEKLDLNEIVGVYEREERGHPPYHPVMMVKLLLYSYCGGLPSSRRIGRGLVEDVALRYFKRRIDGCGWQGGTFSRGKSYE